MFVLGQIIAKALILVDYVLEGFAWANAATITFNADLPDCGVGNAYVGGLTTCGLELIRAEQTLEAAERLLAVSMLSALKVIVS